MGQWIGALRMLLTHFGEYLARLPVDVMRMMWSFPPLSNLFNAKAIRLSFILI
jgi:hypothetical protein